MRFTKMGVMAAAVIALGMSSGAALADTITVHDLTQNVVTGVYTYDIELDAAANVKTGQGWVIYDFPGLVSWSLSGGLSTADFTETGSSLSNGLTTPLLVDAAAAVIPGEFDNPSIPNLTFAYNKVAALTGVHSATLTITTSVLGHDTVSVASTEDQSGPAGLVSISANNVTVPTTAPLPSAAVMGMGGMLALGMVGMLRKRRLA